MGYEMKLVTYEQTREDFFRNEMAKAEMQVRMWQARLQAAKNPIQEMEAHDNASNAAWVYNYYKDAIEAFSSIPKWISVEERLPKCGERVLITEGSCVFEAYRSISNKWVRNGIGWAEDVTHWMPLPEGLKEG